MKRAFATLIMAIVIFMVFSGSAFAAGTEITKTFEVKGEGEVPQTITEGGKQYKLKDVVLKSIEAERDKTLTKNMSIARTNKNLIEAIDLFPMAEAINTEDGYKGTAFKRNVVFDIDMEHSVFGRMVEVKEEVDHGYLYETPDPEPYIEQDYFDVVTNYLVHIKIPYVKTVKVGSGWYPARYYTLELAADQDGRYYLPKAQEILNVNENAPGAEYTEDIIWLLGLEADHYRVADSSWKNEVTENEQGTRRTVTVEIEERGQKYVSQYARTLDVPVIPRYTSTATYEGTAAKTVKEIDPETAGLYEATAIYEVIEKTETPQENMNEPDIPEAGNPPVTVFDPAPYIAAGAAAATGGIIIILLWRRSRNVMILQWNEEAQAYRIIKRLRVIVQEPIIIDITQYTGHESNIFVQIKKKFIDRAGERDIIIINGLDEISANKVVENGYAMTKIS